MLSREQAQATAKLVHLLRPAWNVEGIYAALSRCRDREAHDVALAALRAAADPNVRTPGVIPSPGPHWHEVEPTTPAAPRLPRLERRARTCATCGFLDCSGNDHPFIPLDQATAGRTLAADLARQELAAVERDLCSHRTLRRHCSEHRESATEVSA